MEKVSLKKHDELAISNFAIAADKACTCIYCGFCTVCVVIPPFVGVVLAPNLAASILDYKNGS